jgi:hypothetical protein
MFIYCTVQANTMSIKGPPKSVRNMPYINSDNYKKRRSKPQIIDANDLLLKEDLQFDKIAQVSANSLNIEY